MSKEEREKKEKARLVAETNEDDLVADEAEDIEYDDDSIAQDKFKKLRAKLKECEKEKQEYLLGWQRQKADSVNEKKRLQEDLQKAKDLGKKEVVELILPALDSFDAAFSGDAWENVDENWRRGVEFIHKQLADAMTSLQTFAFAKTGDRFDAGLHEAVKEELTDDEELAGTIKTVLRKGYKMGDIVLRPAQVEVYSLNALGPED